MKRNNDRDHPIHKPTEYAFDFSRLDMLWEKYPKYHEKSLFSSLNQLLEEHESYQKDFDDTLREEYIQSDYERFLVQLSWADLPYRQDTRRMIEEAGALNENTYVSSGNVWNGGSDCRGIFF